MPFPLVGHSRLVPTGQKQLRQVHGQARSELEQFIAQRYADIYGAHVTGFMPKLYALYDEEQQLIAAFGLRAAADYPLFLERYLDQPAEVLVGKHFGGNAQRAGVVEIGNLAGTTTGALRALIPCLTEMLYADGYQWLAFTGAAPLCNAFSKLGLPLVRIAQADVEKLPEAERLSWGRYYDRKPWVMFGDVRQGRARLHRLEAIPGGLSAVETVGLP